MPAPLPADVPEIDALPLPIMACAACGSPGVRALSLQEGGIPGVTEIMDRVRCGRCGEEGLAVEFVRHEDYRSFLRRIALTEDARRRS